MKVIIELVIIHYILKINARIILFNGLFNYLQLLQYILTIVPQVS